MYYRIFFFAVITIGFTLSITDRTSAQALFIPESITFCDEIVPLGSYDVRERLETQLMILSSQRVQVSLWFKRRNRFFPFIEKILAECKVHPDLKYIPVIESSLVTRARSNQNALGPWQFMEPTGKEKGLSITGEIDERLHLEKATHAAIDYLSSLKSEFGSWFLALAAYNTGQGRIREVIYNQGTSNYFEMILPDETERYVFNAIAVKLIFDYPEKYGFSVADIESFPNPEYREIEIKLINFIPVKILAFCAGTCYRELRQLNPWLLGVNLPKGSYKLRIPVNHAGEFNQKMDRYFERIQGFVNFKHEKRFTVKSTGGNMRLGPHTDYPTFRVLTKDSSVKVSGRTDRLDRGHYWYIFKQKNGASGWIWGGEISE